MTKAHAQAIFNYCKDLDLKFEFSDYITAKDIENFDKDDIFNDITEHLEEKYAFDQEVLYYGSAMEYLTKNDTSLSHSLELAAEKGYNPSQLNSEILASLLKSELVREDWQNQETDVSSYADDLPDIDFEEYDTFWDDENEAIVYVIPFEFSTIEELAALKDSDEDLNNFLYNHLGTDDLVTNEDQSETFSGADLHDHI